MHSWVSQKLQTALIHCTSSNNAASNRKIENLRVRLIFDLGKKKWTPVKNLLKLEIAKFGYEML
jgi:hypothetical protein